MHQLIFDTVQRLIQSSRGERRWKCRNFEERDHLFLQLFDQAPTIRASRIYKGVKRFVSFKQIVSSEVQQGPSAAVAGLHSQMLCLHLQHHVRT